MKLHKLFFAFLLGFVLCLSFTTTAAAKDEWTKARSKNFQLAGDASEKDIRAAARRLEQFREFFREFFADVNFDSPIPVNVVVFKGEQSLRDFTLPNQNGAASDYLVISAENKPLDLRAAFHAYVHFLVNENFGRSQIQPWISEGLAEYYETFQIENDQKVTLGNLSAENLRLLQENRLIPFEAFFETDYHSLRNQEGHGAGLFYAQARVLTHYLMNGENSRLRGGQFNKFVQLLLQGKNQRYVFAEAFQVDYATMERELKTYVEQKKFPAAVTSLKNKLLFDNEIQTAPMTEAEAKIVLGDLLYQANRLTESAAMFEEALKLDGNSSLAASSLGLVKIKQGKSDEAAALLEKAVRLDDKNYLAHYRYAYFLSRAGMTEYGFVSNYTPAQAALIRESLDKAIALNPNFPDSYNLYAFVNYVRSEAIDRAAEYLDRALKIAPGNQWNQMRVAELAMRKEDFAKARRTARRIYETAPDDRLRVYAKNTISLIDDYESMLDSLRNPNRRKRFRQVPEQPLSDEESARFNLLAMLEAINENLRRPKSDEKRILGYLTRIECGANGIVYSIKSDEQSLKLSSETFDSVKLISYSADTSGRQIGCDLIKNELFAVIVYRPAAKASVNSAGELLSIEFVPKSFRFFN